MTLQRPVILSGLRAFAVTLVAAASLQLALHIAEAVFLVRQGLGGDARFAMVLGYAGAVVAGTWLYHHSQAMADRLVTTVRQRQH